ncbi:hypothetical protein RUND412_009863 [Rhizina undulata]
MPTINDMICTIISNRQPLPEYPAPLPQNSLSQPSKPSSSSTVYIQSNDNEPFEISFCATDAFPWPKASWFRLKFILSIDGVYVDNYLLHAGDASNVFRGAYSQRDDGSWERRGFLFSGVKVGEDGAGVENKVGELGEIKVEVRRFRINLKAKAAAVVPEAMKGGKRHTQEMVISETVLKGSDVTHSVKRSDAEECNPRNFVTGKILDFRKPYMVFRFLYRSERGLKYLGLIPRSPSPEPDPDGDIDNMTQAELVEELKKLRAQMRPGVKREHETTFPNEPGSNSGYKRQRIHAAIKAETIDLTNEED